MYANCVYIRTFIIFHMVDHLKIHSQYWLTYGGKMCQYQNSSVILELEVWWQNRPCSPCVLHFYLGRKTNKIKNAKFCGKCCIIQKMYACEICKFCIFCITHRRGFSKATVCFLGIYLIRHSGCTLFRHGRPGPH